MDLQHYFEGSRGRECISLRLIFQSRQSGNCARRRDEDFIGEIPSKTRQWTMWNVSFSFVNTSSNEDENLRDDGE